MESKTWELEAAELSFNEATSRLERLPVNVEELGKDVDEGDAAGSYRGMSKTQAILTSLFSSGPIAPADLIDTILDGGFKTTSPRKSFDVSVYTKLKDLEERGKLEERDKKCSVSVKQSEEG